MRKILIAGAILAMALSVPALAAVPCATVAPATQAAPVPLVPIEPEPVREPALLSPLAADSPWMPRFAAAADALLAAIQSGKAARWLPMLGGQWLAPMERKRIAALLADRCGAFAALRQSDGPFARRILGWRVPSDYGGADIAALTQRPEAEALVCWSASPNPDWPATAQAADNRAVRPYACARISYSLRGDTPQWRGFIEQF